MEMRASFNSVLAAISASKNPQASLIAVSKTKSADQILELYNMGHRDFGENYIQELEEKSLKVFAQLPSDIRWHFIGNLQSNKVKQLLRVPNLLSVQTLNSRSKADALNKGSQDRAVPLEVMIQVNSSQEESKGGVESYDEILDLARHVTTSCDKLKLTGLMTIGRANWNHVAEGSGNPDFLLLKSMRDSLFQDAAISDLGLSMGMSDDFLHAIEMGSTCLHSEFRLPELKSIILAEGLLNCEFDESKHDLKHPFLVISLDSIADAVRIANRAVLIRSVLLLCAEGKTHHEAVIDLPAQTPAILTYLAEKQPATWKFTLDMYNRRTRPGHRVQLMQFYATALGSMCAPTIELDTPDLNYMMCEDYASAGEEPDHVYLGIWLAEGNHDSSKKFDLKKRGYLGTTSMDAQLSLIMGNQALAKPGSLIYDPFVGTGSFLLTCAHYGAYTMGCDIDGRQLRGLTKMKTRTYGVSANVSQYGLEKFVLDMVVCDHSRHPFRTAELYDAIVTDPPYGVRAGAIRIKSTETELNEWERQRFPTTEAYDMEQVVVDLINFSAAYLVKGGRLVFWIPTVTTEYSINDLPTHPWLRLVSNSPQCFGKWERRLITMEKTCSSLEQPQPDEVGAVAEKAAHANFRMKYFSSFGKE